MLFFSGLFMMQLRAFLSAALLLMAKVFFLRLFTVLSHKLVTAS